MTHLQTIEKTAQVLRAQVCPTCRYRQGDVKDCVAGVQLPCECKCPLFANLGILANAAEQLDPMIGNRRKRLAHLVGAIGDIPIGENKKHYRFGRRTVEVLDNVLPK